MPRPCLYSLGPVSAGLLRFKKGGLALAATSSYCFALKGGSNYSFTFGEGEWSRHNKKARMPVAKSMFAARCLPASFGTDLNLSFCLK